VEARVEDHPVALRLEFWRGRVIANLWFEDVIIVINPVTGKVEKEYGTSWLNNLSKSQRASE
jgi:glutamine cyclotransferase